MFFQKDEQEERLVKINSIAENFNDARTLNFPKFAKALIIEFAPEFPLVYTAFITELLEYRF